MKRCFQILIFTLFSLQGYATIQSYERLIIEKDTMWMNSFPLEKLISERKITPKDLWGEKFDFNTACYRTYIGTWEIRNDSLFLNELLPCNYSDYKKGEYPKIDLSKIFPDKLKGKRVFADWVNGELLVVRGKRMFLLLNEEIVYERNTGYVIENGIRRKTNEYDNSKSKKSEYVDDTKLLRTYIYTNIQWNKIKSEIDSTDKKVYCTIISCDDLGKIDSVKISRGISPQLKLEAIRVVKSIPQWQVIYLKGERKNLSFTIPINFNLKNMNEFNQTSSQ